MFNFLPLYPSYSPLDNQKEFLSLCTVYTLQAFVYTSISLFIALKKKKKKNLPLLATLLMVFILCSLGISWLPSTIGNILGKVSLFHRVFCKRQTNNTAFDYKVCIALRLHIFLLNTAVHALSKILGKISRCHADSFYTLNTEQVN